MLLSFCHDISCKENKQTMGNVYFKDEGSVIVNPLKQVTWRGANAHYIAIRISNGGRM